MMVKSLTTTIWQWERISRRTALSRKQGTETHLFELSLPNWPLTLQGSSEDIFHLVGFPWVPLLIVEKYTTFRPARPLEPLSSFPYPSPLLGNQTLLSFTGEFKNHHLNLETLVSRPQTLRFLSNLFSKSTPNGKRSPSRFRERVQVK